MCGERKMPGKGIRNGSQNVEDYWEKTQVSFKICSLQEGAKILLKEGIIKDKTKKWNQSWTFYVKHGWPQK